MQHKKRSVGDWIKAKDDLLGVFWGVITELTDSQDVYFVKPQRVAFEMMIHEEQIVE